ncbi:MerR family transcriptional regulator [Inquilinus sp. Marseille-Q2685]|uniref:MerR family transcriptional regulator n=1 Tax=Inquilinus sp. Marseille-Q2685 TaxID=2866581 RepID=UPI001CE3FEAA|nr:MerR family transcriptional regulator [Inquilinus sp. Marseille-Q2685]
MAGMGGSEAKPTPLRKSATAYRTISEVSDDLAVPQHVLRFWETKFSQVRPLKRGGGRRYYRPEDVQLLRRIQRLLYEEGYTIKGVQRLLKEGKAAEADAPAAAPKEASPAAGPAHPLPVTRTKPGKPRDEMQLSLLAGAGREGRAQGISTELRDELTVLLAELKRLQAALRGDA